MPDILPSHNQVFGIVSQKLTPESCPQGEGGLAAVTESPGALSKSSMMSIPLAVLLQDAVHSSRRQIQLE